MAATSRIFPAPRFMSFSRSRCKEADRGDLVRLNWAGSAGYLGLTCGAEGNLRSG